MKRIFLAAMLSAACISLPTMAATKQQEKMATCNKDAGDKKGDERKAFMKECLSNKPKISEAQQAQRDRMKACNEQAKDKKGDDRKKYMASCLRDAR